MSVVKIYIYTKKFNFFRKSWWPNGERVVLWLEGLEFKTRVGDYVVFLINKRPLSQPTVWVLANCQGSERKSWRRGFDR